MDTQWLFEAYDGSRTWIGAEELPAQDAEPENLFGVRVRTRDGGWRYFMLVDDSCPAYAAKGV